MISIKRSKYISYYEQFCRSNEQRLKNFGKSLSMVSRQYRAKRIDVNFKINALAYTVEVLAGIVIFGLSFLRPATYMYISTQIWYGIIIPSCYLMNCSDIKAFILDRGWLAALSELYSKRPKKHQVDPNRNKKADNEQEHQETQGRSEPIMPNNQAEEADTRNQGHRVVHRNCLENVPRAKKSKRNRLEMDTLEGEHNRGQKYKNKVQCTYNKSIGSDIGDIDISFDESCRRNNEVIVHELISRPETGASVISKTSPIYLFSSNYKSRKVLNKNSKASVYYIRGHPSATQSSKAETGSVLMLLPNQPDYS